MSVCQELLGVSHKGTGAKGLKLSSTAFSGYKQGADEDIQQLIHKLVSTWNAGACRQRISQLGHCASSIFQLLFSNSKLEIMSDLTQRKIRNVVKIPKRT